MKEKLFLISSLSLKKWLYFLNIILLFTPFLFCPYLYFPFITLEHSVFRLIINLSLVLVFYLFFKEKYNLGVFKIPLVKAVLGFLFIAYLSSFLGLNFSNSFFSSTERLEGLFGLTYFILFFLILSFVFSKKEIEDLLKIETFIALVFSLIALILYYSPLVPSGPLKTDRLIGLTGNPSYFGVYLLFNAFFALYFYFKDYLLTKKLYNFWLLISLFFFVLIFINATRAVFVGLIFSLFVITFLLLFRKEKEVQVFRKVISLFTLIIIVLIATFFLLKNSSFIQEKIFLKRLTTFNLKDPATASRILSYQIALRIFLKNPILGWGLDSYRYLYSKNFDPKMAKILPDFMFDRVHNKYLELLIDTGIIGFFFYFVIIYYIFKSLKTLSKDSFLLILPFYGLFIAYFIQNFFIFDFLESYLPFYLSLAFLVSCLKEETKERINLNNNLKKEKKEKQDFSGNLLKYLLFLLVFCYALYSSIKWIILPLKQYYYLIDIKREFILDKKEVAFQKIKLLFYYQTPYQVDVFTGFKRSYDEYKFKLTEKERKDLLEFLTKKGREIFKKKNYDYAFLTAYTDYLIEFVELNPSKKEDLEEVLKELTKYPVPYTNLILAKYYLVIEKDLESGKKELEKVVSQTNFLPQAYHQLFLLEYNLNNIDKANEYLKKAIQLGFLPNDKNLIKYSANLFVKDKDYETILKIYLNGIRLYPKETEFYVRVAAAYGKLKNKEKAIYYAEKVKELDPSLKQAADEFIDLIKNEQWDKIPD